MKVDRTVVGFLRTVHCATFTMLRTLLFLILAQIAKSFNDTLYKSSNSTVNKSSSTTLDDSSNIVKGNVSYITLSNRHNIVVGERNVEPVDCNRLKVTFNVRNQVEHLNGEFKIFHQGQGCGKVALPTPLKNPQPVIISLHSRLSPCNNYDGFEIRTHFKDSRTPKKDNTGPWKAKAFGNCCPHLSTTTTATTTSTTIISITTTAVTITSNENSSAAESSQAPVPKAQIGKAATAGIVVGVVLPILVVAALVTILVKRKRDEKKRRHEEMPVDVNPVYGIYDDGALYNMVEDGNDYYES